MKANSAWVLVAGLMVLLLGVKLFLPYPIPEANKILLPVLPQQEEVEDSQLIEKMLVNNLWDRGRGILDSSVSTEDNEVINELLKSANKNDYAQWQLVGVSFDGERRFAIVQIGTEVKSLKQGEQLPNGAEVAEVLPYGIQTTRLGKNEKFYLFGKK